jgi:hypothetical protein
MAFLRPDADDLDGNWTTQAGSTTLFDVLDETVADDADYIKSGNAPINDIVRLRLSDPAGGVNTSQPVTVRYRYGKSGPGQIDIIVRLKEGTTTRASWSHTNVGTSLTTAAQVLTGGEKSAITNWSNLFIEFEATASGAFVNPDFTSLSYASPGGGEPNELTLSYTYGGADTLVAYGVTSTEATPPGIDGPAIRENIIAGTGTGALEGFSVDPFAGSTLEIIAGQLTAASESATHVHIFISEKNNGGFSETRTAALSNLDFTVPTLTWATNILGTQVIGTAAESLFGTQNTANWTVPGHTVTAVSISGSAVTLTVTPAIETGDVDTVSYSGGDLRDVRGNPVANITAASITNSVLASAMAADTQALYWYAPDSVQRSGSTITAWNDKTAGARHLGQVESIPLPTYNTGGNYVEFDGTQIIGLTTFAHAAQFKAALADGAAVFIVGQLDSSGQAGGTGVARFMFYEGTVSSAFTNNQFHISFITSTFVTPRITRFDALSRGTAGVTAQSGSIPEHTDILFLAQISGTQDAPLNLNVNNGFINADSSASLDSTRLATSNNGLYIGSRWTGSALSESFTGRVYEVFATADSSAANLNAIRAELTTKYGL